MSTNLISKNIMGAAVGAAFVVAFIVCLLSIREKLDFGLFGLLMRCNEGAFLDSLWILINERDRFSPKKYYML